MLSNAYLGTLIMAFIKQGECLQQYDVHLRFYLFLFSQFAVNSELGFNQEKLITNGGLLNT